MPVQLRRVTGRAGTITTMVTRKSADGGWHWAPWGCESLGTAILLAGGLSAVYLDFGSSSPVAAHLTSHGARLLLTGLLFAGTGSLVARSPLGRRSGAHLNPAVTVAFWTQRKVHPHDLTGYIVAQILGALTSVALLHLARGHTAGALHLGATQPGDGLTALDAAGLEALMTAGLVLMIFFFTSNARTARWTPLGNWLLVATLVWQGAPYTGTTQPGTQPRPRPAGPRAPSPVGLHRRAARRRAAGRTHLQRVSHDQHPDRQALSRPALPEHAGQRTAHGSRPPRPHSPTEHSGDGWRRDTDALSAPGIPLRPLALDGSF